MDLEANRLAVMGSPSANPRGSSLHYAAKMQLDESLQSDGPFMYVEVEWAEGEPERLKEGLRFLTADDMEILKSRLASKGAGITSGDLLEGFYGVCAWLRTWTRETGHSWQEFFLLKGQASDMDDSWDWHDEAVRLTSLPLEAIRKCLMSPVPE